VNLTRPLLLLALCAAALAPAKAEVQLECQGSPSSAGPGAILRWTGPETPLGGTLVATRLPANSLSILTYGFQSDFAPFGDGHLCMAPGFFMARKLSSSTGDVSFDISQEGELEDIRYLLYMVEWQQIESAIFQVLYRDIAAGGAGFNTSDAIRVTFE